MALLDDAHPILKDRFEAAALAYAKKHPNRAIRVRQTTRTLKEQMDAFLKGRSKLDPRKKPSMHLYNPSLAIDVWIYEVDPKDQPAFGFWQTKPPVDARLILSPNDQFSSAEITSEYRQWGYEAQSYPDATFLKDAKIVWGGSWKQGDVLDRWRLPSFFDGPHIQLSNKCCNAEVQRLLVSAGFNPGKIDGLWGPATRNALAGFCAKNNIPLDLVPNRAFSVLPDTFAALWEYNER